MSTTPDDLLGLAVADVVKALTTAGWRRVLVEPDGETTYVSARDAGVVVWCDGEPASASQVGVYLSPTKDFSAWSGGLPFGLGREFTRERGLKVLGEPAEEVSSSPRPWRSPGELEVGSWDKWRWSGWEVHVTYDSEGAPAMLCVFARGLPL